MAQQDPQETGRNPSPEQADLNSLVFSKLKKDQPYNNLWEEHSFPKKSFSYHNQSSWKDFSKLAFK